MKTPRDIDATELIKLLRKHFEYYPTRQTGGHIRLKTILDGEGYLTIPNHSPIKIGTLNQILSEVAEHFDTTKDQVMQKLFL
jgi:predicted RNA binding protein YcfA (HicA-like mRNA interferase family)